MGSTDGMGRGDLTAPPPPPPPKKKKTPRIFLPQESGDALEGRPIHEVGIQELCTDSGVIVNETKSKIMKVGKNGEENGGEYQFE